MNNPTMVVLHLTTGQVLAAVAAGARTPTVEDLTGGTSLHVRTPDGTVEVTAELLTSTTVARDADVLTRPTSFRVTSGVPPVTLTSALTSLPASTTAIGAAGAECLSLWQAGDELEVVHDTLDNDGKLPTGTRPPGATHRLVAPHGGSLYHDS
jgi:hypothetical protein